jgi:hypothetical protein
MLEMAARVRSRFIAGDYSWACPQDTVKRGFLDRLSTEGSKWELPFDESFAIIEGCIEFSSQTLDV